MSAPTQVDYVIVGAGSAGCVLANRLSANGRHRVLLLEAGGSDRNPLLRIPILGAFLGVRNPKYDWNYRTLSDPSRNDRKDYWPRGKVLGGSSAINGMIYVRGDRDDYNHWAQMGNKGWAFDDVEPYFRRIEAHEFDEPDYGQDGPVRVRPTQGAHPLSNLFVKANEAKGVPHNPHYNGATQEGTCLLSLTNSGRVRYSSAQAYLQPARRRANLTIRTNCLATHIVLDGSKAVGVQFEHNGQTETVRAAKEVVLAGGSINSPQLLMLSGIGPADHLQEMGIPVVQDLPVGDNLHEHPALMVQAATSMASYNTQLGPLNLVRHGYDWLVHGRGMLSTVIFQALAFIKTDAALSHPDIQLHFAPCGILASDESISMMKENSYSIQANVNRSRSRGTLRLAEPSPATPPAIQANMLGDRYDLETLMAGTRFMFDLCDGEVLGPVTTGTIIPRNRPQTDDEWEHFVRGYTIPTYHPVGTCKMGTDKSAVVSPDLKVIGIDSLRVVDASIMPQVISGNTNAAAMMIGEKGAEMILAEG